MIVEFTTRQVEPDITLVELSGRLTLGNRLTEVEHAIKDCIEKGARKLALDLANLTFMDSAGIGLLLSIYATIRNQGGDLKLLNVSSRVRELLKITDLIKVFQIIEDESGGITPPSTPSSGPHS